MNSDITTIMQNISHEIINEVLESVAWSDRLDVDLKTLGVYAEGENDAGKPVAGSIKFEFCDDGAVAVILTTRDGTRAVIKGTPKIGIA